MKTRSAIGMGFLIFILLVNCTASFETLQKRFDTFNLAKANKKDLVNLEKNLLKLDYRLLPFVERGEAYYILGQIRFELASRALRRACTSREKKSLKSVMDLLLESYKEYTRALSSFFHSSRFFPVGTPYRIRSSHKFHKCLDKLSLIKQKARPLLKMCMRGDLALKPLCQKTRLIVDER